jgi:hypothetical protein
MILDESIKVLITNRNIRYYRERGYNTILGEEIEVLIKDSPKSSGLKINVRCDICDKESKISLQQYNRSIKKFKYYKCGNHRDLINVYAKFDTDIELKIIELYNSGIKVDDIVNRFNISSSSQLHRIVRRGGREKIIPGKKYICNDSFFEKIDTENKAYWLGFLFADGYVRNRKESFSVELKLASKDKEHLLKFREDIESDSKIRDTKIERIYKGRNVTYHTSELAIYSKKMFQDLTKHGCVEKKSLILDRPKNLPDNLIRHFIRGYFDGDGCITIYKQKNKIEYKIIILGTNNLLSWINDVLSLNLIAKKNITNRNNISILQYNTKDKDLLFNYLYSSSTIFLERKYKKFLK